GGGMGRGGFRLIIVGIGVSALLGAANTWLVLRADLDTAMSAAAWGAGSLNGITAVQLAVGAGTAGLALAAVAVLSGGLRQLELGDDGALARGVRVPPVRTALIVAGVGLTAAVTAVAGPIAFVSLVAPQLARRLCRSPGIPLAASAGVGALLLTAADLAAQHALPTAIPVGLVTVVLGGGFLIWLLLREVRR
ncbi:FecCD family ABC transporter permease, partial [Leucobacter sp. M11]|uniref:FecCD family ABC transporter permease n=1 Tax=Leucobacter sp. M11 TaxID=2993565 RepID=UPI002D802E45